MIKRILLALAASLTAVSGAHAQGAASEPTPLTDIPVIESLEPTIEQAREGGARVEEYRIGGDLYMVKVIPQAGPPYYLLDHNGDGILDARQSELEDGVVVPQWILFEW